MGRRNPGSSARVVPGAADLRHCSQDFGRLLLFGAAFDHGRFVVELDLVY
jgi:hypothetical protein